MADPSHILLAMADHFAMFLACSWWFVCYFVRNQVCIYIYTVIFIYIYIHNMHPSPMLWFFNARFIMLSWTCFGKFSHVILHLPTWRHHKVISAVPRLTRPWPKRRWTCQVGGCNGPADWFQICWAHDTARPLVESKEWDRPPINWCRIFSISISWLFCWFEIMILKFPTFCQHVVKSGGKGFEDFVVSTMHSDFRY
jgi:hypothetical protein